MRPLLSTSPLSMTRTTVRRAGALLFTCLSLAACGGDGGNTAGGNATGDAGTPSGTASGATAAPKPTGNSVTIEMITDDSGNYFKPKSVTVKPGDVLKFVLVTGVHNVHFLPDSNANAANLPPMSAFAQLPGQSIDIPVTMGPGTYYFQCDPHAMLGMVGHVIVEP